MLIRRLIYVVFLLLPKYAESQSLLRIRHVNVENGLSQSSVYNIFQDSYGFMWFCTGDGLNRYDGKDFVVYKSHFNDTAAGHLKERNIATQIFEDNKGRLWLSTDDGVTFFDARHGTFNLVLREYARALTKDDRAIWSALTGSGLNETGFGNLRSTFYPFTDKYQSDRSKACAIFNGISTASSIWITDNAGLLYFDKHTHKDRRALVNEKLNACYQVHDGRLLLCAEDGIYFYDPVKNTNDYLRIYTPQFKNPVEWQSFAEDTLSHCIYLGARNCCTVCRLNMDTHNYDFLNFQYNDIYCLYIDRSENLWIGTEGGGVYVLDIKQPKFKCFPLGKANGSGDDEGLMVKAIYRDDSGRIWIGSFNEGLLVYNPTNGMTNKLTPASFGRNKQISSIQKDSSGYMVVTCGPCIAWLDAASGSEVYSIRLPVVPSASLKDPIIFSITEWRKNKYLVATHIGFFTCSIPSAGGRPPYYLRNMRMWTYDLLKGPQGTVYAGRREGFSVLKMVNDTTMQVIYDGLKNLATRHFYKKPKSPLLWVATEEGLLAYDEVTKKITVFDEAKGLANSFVYAILPQNDSTLWISTNKGISNIRVHYCHDSVINTQVINYTSDDGLQSNEFNTGAHFMAADGTMYFGGITGINWFNPVDIKPNPYKPIPAIADIYINDKFFADDTATFISNLTLPFDRNTISLTLRALEFTRPERNRYAYKMEGLDRGWVYTASDKVRYSGLHPGSYTFLLKAANNDGVWCDKEFSMHITILPPYWQTWWFRSLLVAGAAVAIYLTARYYVRQKVKAKMIAFEKQQALNMERLRISKDVHDDLGSGLSKISLMAEIAQKRVVDNANLSNDIRHISTVSKELVENMRDLIWVLNPHNTSLDQLVARLREYCTDYLEHMPVGVQLDFPHDVPTLPISREVQRNIFLTVKEAINNCIRHAHAGEIRVSLCLDGGTLNIKIADNGMGFDTAQLKGSGNGLRNMRQRIEFIGGSFAISSCPGLHTIIQVAIPFSKLGTDNIPL